MKVFYLLAISILIVACESTTKKEQDQTDTIQEPIVEEIPEPTLAYGFVTDSFIVDTGRIAENEGLTHVLPKYGITLGTIYQIADKFDSIFDVRKIKPNHKFMVLSHMEDTLKVADHFIYEIDAIDYLVYDFNDSLWAHIDHKPMRIDTLMAGGMIQSSLWNAFVEQDLSPAMVSKVSDLYAWSVDFFGLQKGDYFKVIYEARYVEDEFVGVGNILAVLFNHRSKDNYFFRYETDTAGYSYFTEKGEQMQKALLSAPLEFKRVSSKFSHRRFHPVLKIYRPHYGVDYAAPTGTEVVATGTGKVIFAGRAGGAGKMVKIKHDVGDIVTKYLHLSKYGPGIKKGVRVTQGQKIGEVGSTGTSTGPHLDYRIYIKDKPVDPLSIDIPSVDPLTDSALVNYNNFMLPIKSKLDAINASVAVSDTLSMDFDSTIVQ